MDATSAWALATLVGCVVVVLTLANGWWGPLAEPADAAHQTSASLPAAAPRRLAIIAHGAKLDDPIGTRDALTALSVRHGWAEPLWYETTRTFTGRDAVQQALEQGVELVCALGGDGTVRSVASGMIHTSATLAILPYGTGNLLARNLDIPLDSLQQAMAIALNGQRTVDLDVGLIAARDARGAYLTGGGHPSPTPAPDPVQPVPRPPSQWTRLTHDDVPPPSPTSRPVIDPTPRLPLRLTSRPWVHADAFFVMAGIGFDAQVMADAPEVLKSHMGWGAYVVSGLQNLHGPRFMTSLSIDGNPPQRRKVQSVMVGNVGRIQGGVALFPAAEATDGVLDALVLTPKTMIDWASVATSIVTGQPEARERVTHHRCSQLILATSSPQQVQIDGDIVGKASLLHIGVLPGAVKVRYG